MTAQHILAVNLKIAEVKGLDIDSSCGQIRVGVLHDVAPITVYVIFSPMTSWHDAGPLVEELVSGVWEVKLMEYTKGSFVAECTSDGHEFEAHAKSIPEAICYAYLRANGIENPERLGVE